jgi:hypothetical protein
MDYPAQATPIHLDGVDGRTIENLSFEGFTRDKGRPITLYNCKNITIRNIDTRKCTIGLVYAYNCENLRIENVRCENIAWEFRNEILDRGKYTQPGYFRNENDCNVYQLNNCRSVYVRNVKARYGNIEDAFSHYKCYDCDVAGLHWEGANSEDRPTSDGSISVRWTSRSGTGSILGDGNGSRNVVADSIYVNPGQVGIAIAGGTDCTFDNCIVYGEEGGFKPLNVAAYVWGQYSQCARHAMTNCRTDFANNNEWWNGGNCGAVNLAGTDFGDSSLDIEDLRVVF